MQQSQREASWRRNGSDASSRSAHQRIFAERFDPGIVAPRSRRTARLDGFVHCLGVALGGRPGASFAKRLMLPVSSDTLLRTVRRRSQRQAEPLRVVGVDDWAASESLHKS